MNESEDEDNDLTLDCVEIDETVREIFDNILDEPIKQFEQPLEFIKENKFGAVWRCDTERHDKVMVYAQKFMKSTIASFLPRHPEATKHIEGSTCEVFINYIYKRLDESLLGQDPFDDSCKELKNRITCKILRIKDTLETQNDELPKHETELEIMILNTNLLDPIHIHHALLCCQVAYKCENPERSKQCLEELEVEHLISELSVSYENEHVPKYVMARCGDVLYVCFKGMQNHNFGRTDKSFRGEINSGLLNAAKKIPLKYFARSIIHQKRIVFTGHSSGGAIASLVMIFLLERFKQNKTYLQSRFKCITFGLIPLGDGMLGRYVEAIPGAQDCFCHVVQKDDIVPKLFGCTNMTRFEAAVWEVVENVLQASTKILSTQSVLDAAAAPILPIFEHGRHFHQHAMNMVGYSQFDIFGMYYILDTSQPVQKYLVHSASEARRRLTINDGESLNLMHRQYLINHKIERYAHEVALTLTRELPDFKKFKSTCSMAIANDVTPKIAEVRFESIGEEVVAKIAGSNMWFVYNASIEGVNGDGNNLDVDITKSSENEVQARMREASIRHEDKVRVRVKTHFQDSRYLPATEVLAKTTTYPVTRRQQQLAKHRPSDVIELAYLSALLERRHESYSSPRFKAIESFFKNAVTVVPLESIFHAIAQGGTEVMLQCCEILSSGHDIPMNPQPSEFFITGMKNALERIRHFQDMNFQDITPENSRHFQSVYSHEIPPETIRRLQSNFRHDIPPEFRRTTMTAAQIERENYSSRPPLDRGKVNKTLNETITRIVRYLSSNKKKRRRKRKALCKIDLEVLYPSTEDKAVKRDSSTKNCKAPTTLLTEGRKELTRISEELIAEQSCFTDGRSTLNTNTKMLNVLNGLREKFKTCSTLLGAFMESQVQIPLEKVGGNKYVNEFAKHAQSIGLSVWGLLILPFNYLNNVIGLPREFGQLVLEFSRHIHRFQGLMFPPNEHQFPEYDEKLEFLVGSMNKSWASNEKYISYSLERQLEDQCKKRGILHSTPVKDILAQWDNNFEAETLTLVPREYRPLVARWMKWSLMINNLRENLASQTAVGVIGLVNSGKSKFVRSLFGEETITGTTDQKRTTVPLIYNLGQNIKGMDVIDFPGVDDRDKSIPELAKLLLSLTRIIVFVVDYRRAHTESTKQWLSILESENVPVLICLTFADKLYAELMGENGDCDAEKVKAGVKKQLNTIKEKIGETESGYQRDLKFTVFAFDNDSKLNTDENKEKLRKAGLNDELDVGRWIAEKLQDYEQNDVAQNVIKFIEKKERSTLNSNKIPPVSSPGKEEKSDTPSPFQEWPDSSKTK